jgi:hypothetical protein
MSAGSVGPAVVARGRSATASSSGVAIVGATVLVAVVGAVATVVASVAIAVVA